MIPHCWTMQGFHQHSTGSFLELHKAARRDDLGRGFDVVGSATGGLQAGREKVLGLTRQDGDWQRRSGERTPQWSMGSQQGGPGETGAFVGTGTPWVPTKHTTNPPLHHSPVGQTGGGAWRWGCGGEGRGQRRKARLEMGGVKRAVGKPKGVAREWA